jgi:hypothetical protein
MASRDDLIDAVAHGRMSPEEADAEALRLGLEPLSFKPDPADHDPMREPYWTPVMAIAWIVWRSPDAVREAWAAYAAGCRGWRFHRLPGRTDDETVEGFSLEPYASPSLVTLHLVDIAPRAVGREPRIRVVPLGEARDQFLRALRDGLLTATGVALSNGRARGDIAQVEWIDLDFAYDDDQDRFRRKRSFGGEGFGHVLVRRKQVVKLWKPGPAPRPEHPPVLVPPDGPGFMTVFHALFWIATAGGARKLGQDDAVRWQTAFDALLPWIASGHVMLTGERDGERVTIPPHVLAACRFDGPIAETPADLLFGSDLYLRSFAHIDDEQWRNGFDDALMVGQQERWTRLMVPKEQVGKIWPPGFARRRSGGAGRPSSMDLVEREFECRKEAGEIEATLAAQARVLAAWFPEAHPGEVRPTAKTIENRLRDLYRKAKAPK